VMSSNILQLFSNSVNHHKKLHKNNESEATTVNKYPAK